MHIDKTFMETQQSVLYFAAVAAAILVAQWLPHTETWAVAINPALAFMLFVTFLQVPLVALTRSLRALRFLAALLTANFLVVPLLLACLAPYLPADPVVRLGILLVLLAPCIDYVVTFSHLGRADAPRLLAATPVLLLAQMLLLPVYLKLLLGAGAASLIQAEPFAQAFLWLILVPLALAGLLQWGRARSAAAQRLDDGLGWLTVPATALVIFIVVASVIPQIAAATDSVIGALPFYVLFALVAPLAGALTARFFRVDPAGRRAIAFSSATRNSLVILPLALAIPGAMPVLPAIIVSQTLIELIAELIYIRIIPRAIV